MIGALLLLGLGAVGGIAYFTAGPGATSAPQQALAPLQPDAAPLQPAAEPRLAPPPARALAQAPARRPATAAGVAPPSPAPPAPSDPRAELHGRVTQEAKAQLDTYRNEIVSRCWPANGLPRGARTARLTVNATFDAQGHEIARGISEDRRAPAGEFARCVRNLGGIRLGVAPPGSSVAISIPMSYP